ncbi:MAG: MarC family protein [Actinobacteria bacterium]|nr:MarC family protein [Actinomycetota bacterium]
MLEFIFNSLVTLLVVVDPLGLAPIFAALTRGYPEKRKREAAIRGTALGAIILFLFALAGDVLLEALGIGIPAFRIAGGILLFLLSLDMIFASPTGLRSRTIREQEEFSYEDDVSVFPLAIPLIAGPGAITTVLLYTGERSATELAAFVGVLLAVLLLTLASLLLAPRIMRLFGETGSNVLTRVLGVLLAALAVQFVLDGIGASLA